MPRKPEKGFSPSHSRKVKKVTEKEIFDFYKKLGLNTLKSLPVGSFVIYTPTEVTFSPNSGV